MSTEPGQKPESAEEMIQLFRVSQAPLPYGEIGEGLKFHTNRGEFSGIIHRAEDATQAAIFVCGARSGFVGPGAGPATQTCRRHSRSRGSRPCAWTTGSPTTSWNACSTCSAGVNFLKADGYGPVVIAGHSFGGAVVIAAGANSSHIKGCGFPCAPQTYGAGMAGQLAPRKLLVAHGKADTRLPYSCALQIHEWAKEPKELVLFEDAEHRLEECRDELETLLAAWIPATLEQEIEIPAIPR